MYHLVKSVVKLLLKGARWSKYPEKWNTEECYSDDDANAGMDAAVIRGGKCVDNETQVEGIYMMGFGTDIGKDV